MRLALLTLIILTSNALGTTFVPVSLVDQLSSSDAVVHGKYQGMSYKKLKTGEVVTEHTLKIESVAGIDNHKIINRYNYKFITPGGEWQGQGFYFEGVPKFTKGEEVILLLRDTPFGHVVNNLSLGKYSLQKKVGETLLVNNVFPENKKLSKISYKKFNELIENEFGSKLYEVGNEKFVYKGKTRKKDLSLRTNAGRAPASKEEEVQGKGVSILTLALIFGMIGFYRTYAIRKKHKNK